MRVFFFALLCAALFARGACADDSLAAAQAAYDEGVALRDGDPRQARRAFERAAAGFREAVEAGADNAGIHFNLGNALVQSGDVGRGIASYLRARRFAPDDPALAANLAHARGEVRLRIPGEAAPDRGDLVAWWRIVSERTRFLLFTATWILAWTLAGLGVAGVALPKPLPTLRIASGVIALVLGATLLVDFRFERTQQLGVVIADEAILRKGNGDGFSPQITEALGPGVEFLLRETRPGWLRVRLADGTDGWLREEQVELVDRR